MAKCPKCGTFAATPVKAWPIPSRRPLGENEQPRLSGIFDCPNCKARFRAALEVGIKAEEAANIKNVVEKLKEVRGGFVQTLKNLREKIKTLENERADLIIEIEKLKKVADSRVSALESEVTMLREEVKSLRDILGYTEGLEK